MPAVLCGEQDRKKKGGTTPINIYSMDRKFFRSFFYIHYQPDDAGYGEKQSVYFPDIDTTFYIFFCCLYSFYTIT